MVFGVMQFHDLLRDAGLQSLVRHVVSRGVLFS